MHLMLCCAAVRCRPEPEGLSRAPACRQDGLRGWANVRQDRKSRLIRRRSVSDGRPPGGLGCGIYSIEMTLHLWRIRGEHTWRAVLATSAFRRHWQTRMCTMLTWCDGLLAQPLFGKPRKAVESKPFWA